MNNNTKQLLEAILFVASKPLSVKEMSEVLQLSEEQVISSLEELKKEYENKGVRIIQAAEEFKMSTCPEAASVIEKFHQVESKHFLSKAALETLSIIAFKQPVTRAQIEELRGVNVDKIIYNLLDKKLVKEVGRATIPGRPILYSTTKEFLRYFNLNSLDDLPQIQQQSETPKEDSPI